MRRNPVSLGKWVREMLPPAAVLWSTTFTSYLRRGRIRVYFGIFFEVLFLGRIFKAIFAVENLNFGEWKFRPEIVMFLAKCGYISVV